MAEDDRRAQILEAAFEEFSARGYEGATIRGIARRAELKSLALIYWHFPDKEALFGAVLAERVPVLRAVADLEDLMDRRPREVLARLGKAYLRFDEENKGVLRLVIGEAMHRPEVASAFVEEGPGRLLRFLQRYLQRQVQLGRLVPHDARSSARAFIGMLIPQVATNVFLPAPREGDPTDEEHLENCVGIFLLGLEVRRKVGLHAGAEDREA